MTTYKQGLALLLSAACPLSFGMTGRCKAAVGAEKAPVRTQGLQAFWREFQAAIATDDKQKVAGMTFFPFRGHPFKEELTRQGFLDNYAKVFTPNFRSVFS